MTTQVLDEHILDVSDPNKTGPNHQRGDVVQWQCLNCGQHIFVVVDIVPPDTCQYCKDMTTWQLIKK